MDVKKEGRTEKGGGRKGRWGEKAGQTVGREKCPCGQYSNTIIIKIANKDGAKGSRITYKIV